MGDRNASSPDSGRLGDALGCDGSIARSSLHAICDSGGHDQVLATVRSVVPENDLDSPYWLRPHRRIEHVFALRTRPGHWNAGGFTYDLCR